MAKVVKLTGQVQSYSTTLSKLIEEYEKQDLILSGSNYVVPHNFILETWHVVEAQLREEVLLLESRNHEMRGIVCVRCIDLRPTL